MSVDYDRIAPTYDRRYQDNVYPGVEQALAAFADRDAGRVLEVGCGTGHWLRLLGARGVRTAGLDASRGMLERARAEDRRAALVCGRAEHLPWTDDSFDRLFCVNALHHFSDTRRFLAEARRVLRPGGRLMTIGLDPHAGVDRWYVYDYFEPALETDRQRYAAAAQIREWMESAGFVDCATREAQHLPMRLAARAALEQGRLDRHATSQLSLLSDAQHQRGFDRIRADIAAADARGTPLDLIVDLRLYATTGVLP